ncbi:MAG: RagB/SusD family nutrient uptake outer membrane protein [Bacteroidota bacterium]|nr:RagB/SusD family nutrient uptake outer membrane protein [Bacteroidota bacterium]
MTRRIFQFIAIISMVVLLGSCKKFLTQDSLTQALPSDYFHKVSDINSSLAGMYSAFQGEMKSNYFYWGECRSDNFNIGGWPNTTIDELAVNGLTATNGACSWAGLYKTIGRANNGIKYIPNVAKYDNTANQTVINNAMAQCYAMRAMCYFYIVRNWGSAPIWTAPYEDLSQSAIRPRASQDSIINSIIIPDLQNAYNIIQKGQTPTVWYIGEGAICAMLADVYMWKNDYASALQWFPKLFAAKTPTGTKSYVPTGAPQLTDIQYVANTTSTDPAAKAAAILAEQNLWKANFLAPQTSVESIWSIHWDYLTNGYENLPVAVSQSNNPVAQDSAVFVDWQKVTADIRWPVTYDKTISARDKLTKYLATADYKNTQANQYLVMYRLSDQILLYAEALNQTGNSTEALRLVNLIRTRAYLPTYLATDPLVATQAALQTTILNERRYELFGEGKRWYDLIRNNMVLTVMDPVIKLRQKRVGAAQTGFGDPRRILWPINNQLIINSQGVLTQNPGY